VQPVGGGLGKAQQERTASGGHHALQFGFVHDLRALRVGDDEARLEGQLPAFGLLHPRRLRGLKGALALPPDGRISSPTGSGARHVTVFKVEPSCLPLNGTTVACSPGIQHYDGNDQPSPASNGNTDGHAGLYQRKLDKTQTGQNTDTDTNCEC
jgi:hypothetical protein